MNAYVNEKVAEREANLKGKWVITQESRYDKNVKMYLPDRELMAKFGRKENWTKFLANAKGFETEYQAKAVARNFKYGKIEVVCVK